MPLPNAQSSPKVDDEPDASSEPKPAPSPIKDDDTEKPVAPKPAKPVLQWKSAVFPSEERLMVLPTYVAHDGSVYLQLLGSGTDKIKLINTALEMMYTNTGFSKPEDPLVVGQACVALFALDNKWYRAEVLKVLDQHIEVLFVDYGNNEWVTLENVRTPLLLMEIPRQCVRCDLFGIEPESSDGEWPNTTLDFVHTNIVEKTCTMTVKEKPSAEKRAKVLLHLDDSLEVTELLVSMGVARPSLDIVKVAQIIQSTEAIREAVAAADANRNVPTAILTVPENDDNVDDNDDDNDDTETYSEATLPTVGQTFPVVVSELISPDMLYIQRHKASSSSSSDEDNGDEFLKLIDDLAQHADDFPAVDQAEPGVAYCGKYTYDDKWYRCIVVAVEDEKVCVQYVDYGNCEIITSDRLRRLPNKYLAVPVQSMLCKLNGVVPTEDEWTDDARRSMHKLLFEEKQELRARIKSVSPVLEIDLLTSSNADDVEALVYQPLVDQGVIGMQKSQPY